MPTIFETEDCSRCWGSGHYSRCPGYGTKCFQCRGSGKQLTARGAAAYAYMESLLTEKSASEFKVGEWYKWAHAKSHKIVRIGHDADGRIELHNAKGVTVVPFHMMLKLVPDDVGLKVLQSKALEYQATLTEAGKPRKGL